MIVQVARSSSVSAYSTMPRNGPFRMRYFRPPSFRLVSARFNTNNPVEGVGFCGAETTVWRNFVCGGKSCTRAGRTRCEKHEAPLEGGAWFDICMALLFDSSRQF